MTRKTEQELEEYFKEKIHRTAKKFRDHGVSVGRSFYMARDTTIEAFEELVEQYDTELEWLKTHPLAFSYQGVTDEYRADRPPTITRRLLRLKGWISDKLYRIGIPILTFCVECGEPLTMRKDVDHNMGVTPVWVGPFLDLLPVCNSCWNKYGNSDDITTDTKWQYEQVMIGTWEI